jgi:hypothetical protein
VVVSVGECGVPAPGADEFEHEVVGWRGQGEGLAPMCSWVFWSCWVTWSVVSRAMAVSFWA